MSIYISDLYDSFFALKAGSGCADLFFDFVGAAQLSSAFDPQSLANHPCSDFFSG